MAKVVTRGVCEFCGQDYSRRGIKRHLDSCSRRRMETGGRKPYYTLSVEGAYERDYWLFVEIAGDATLEDLDRFLRDIWLECCGHLSQFRIGRDFFLCAGVDREWGELSMDIAIQNVAQPGLVFEHEYDFGSTTTLKLTFVSGRLGVFTKGEKIQLLARNIAPDLRCESCGGEATLFFSEDHTLLCDSCAEKHGDEEEWSLPVCNSPRTGVCGYGEDYWLRY